MLDNNMLFSYTNILGILVLWSPLCTYKAAKNDWFFKQEWMN